MIIKIDYAYGISLHFSHFVGARRQEKDNEHRKQSAPRKEESQDLSTPPVTEEDRWSPRVELLS